MASGFVEFASLAVRNRHDYLASILKMGNAFCIIRNIEKTTASGRGERFFMLNNGSP